MSLFKTREFWSTTILEDDEFFDQNSIITTKLKNGESDVIISGSQSGVLRIFKPTCEILENNNLSGYDVADLILEKIFSSPILQVGVGRLVSGSQNLQIAVLHPRLLSIYYLTTKEGTTEHGTQHILQTMYEHRLKRLAFNFVIGTFGGTQNRDFLCVQSLDGMLTFLEQESLTFNCNLPEFLLPGPISYIKKTDSFVTLSSNWCIESYRYKYLSENALSNEKVEKTVIKCDWSYNLGEAVLEIIVIDDFINKETWIMILGEKNFYCLNDSGKMKFMKKLDYLPVCFNSYVLEEKVITTIVSDTQTLLLYQNTTLKWSAQLQLQPVAIKRAFLENVKGALVLLTEEGRLECCYLGTEPSLFVAPPLTMKEIDFEKAGEELSTLNKIIKNSYGKDIKVNNATAERELTINLSVNPHLETCTHEHNLPNALNNQMCTLSIDILPQAIFEEVQISILVQKPLKIVPQVEFYGNLCDRTLLKCNAFLNEPYQVGSLNVQVVASFISSMGIPKTLCKTTLLPLKLVLETCQPQRESEHKITLNLNYAPISLATLFPEYVGENSLSQSTTAIGFRNVAVDENLIVTILLAKSSERYRFQSNSFASMNLLIEQIMLRLKKHFSDKNDFSLTFNSSLPANELLLYVNEHFTVRQKVNQLQSELTTLGSQFRLIQKRLIEKFKAKNPAPVSNMEILLDDTFEDIIQFSDSLELELNNLSKTQTELSCALNLITNLIDLMELNNKDILAMVKSTFCPDICEVESQNWEDVLDGSLCYLLRTVMAKSEKDKLRLAQTSFDEVKDIAKLEKHLVQVLERVPKKGAATDLETALEEENIVEEEEKSEKELLPVGSQFGESSSRLFSARKSLLKLRQMNEIK